MDVITAYLSGELQEEIFMTLPEGLTLFISSLKLSPTLVCKLRKALYGLKQSRHTWYQRLFKFLISIGFIVNEADTNVYSRHDDHKFIILAIYVDDCLLITNDNDLLQKTKQQLSLEFDMIDLGPVTKSTILGLEITYQQDIGHLKISQSKYINSLLSKFKMESCNPVTTPMETGIKLTKDDSPTTQEEQNKMKNFPYKTLVGSLLHLSLNTRPDISFSTSIVAQYLANPGLQHWHSVKRILRYLKGTISFGLLYKRSQIPLILRGFADANWAGNIDDRQSTSGYCFSLGNCLISWASRKQRSVALSSTESEYMSLSKASTEAIWLC